MKQWMIVLVGTLLLTAGVLIVTATAANVVASGECGDKGDNVTWTLDSDGLLIVSGAGNMKDVGSYNYLFDKAVGQGIKIASIQHGVTSIGSCAFHSSVGHSLTSITIPDSIMSIGIHAFQECNRLQGIVIPNSVINIGHHAFYNCDNLSNITLSNNISVINQSTFGNCFALSNIVIPDSVISIESYAFVGCSSLTHVTIPSKVTEIKGRTFYLCRRLDSVVIPSSIKTIEKEAFANTGLTDVYYSGSEAQWKAISISSGNERLTSANIHYNSYGPNIGPYHTPIATAPDPSDTEALRKAGEQKLQKLYQGFETAYTNYTAKIRDILTEEGSDKQNMQVDYEEQAKKLMEADENTGFVSITGSAIGHDAPTINKRAKLHAYMAVCQMLNEKADAKGLDFSKIGFSDPLSAESKIVTQIRNSLSRYNKTFDYSGSEVTIRCLNAQVKKSKEGAPLQFGSVSVKESIPGEGLYVEYTAVICTSVSDGEQLIAAYLNGMRDLMSNAVTNVYASLIQDLLGKSVSELTTNLIKKKITGPVAAKLAEHGLDKLEDTLYNCYRYYKLCQDCTEITVDGMTFKDMEENAEKVQNFDFQTPASTSAAKKVASKLEQAERDFMSGLCEFYTTGTITDKGFIGTIKRFFSGKCPISIEVLDASSKQVGYVGDDDLRYEEDTLLIEENGDEKRIYFLTDDPVSVRVTGTDYGTMNCTLEEYEDGTPTGRANFYDIALEAGKSFAASLVTGDGVTKAEDLQFVEDDGDAISATEYLSASSSAAVRIDAQVDSDGGGTVTGGGVYVKGDAVVLCATANDNYAFIGWYGDDDAYLSGDIAYTFTAREDTTVTAYFAENYPSLANYMIEVSEIHQDIYDIAVEQDGDAFTVHVTRLAGAVAGQDVCVFLASYADSGKMTALAQIQKTETATGMDFTGTVSERGSKLFILDEDFRPVINAYVSE